MKTRFVVLLASLPLLAGCSSQISLDTGSPRLRMQSARTSGVQPVRLIEASTLLPGDILLSSSTSLTSISIRLFSITGVSHAALYLGDNQIAEAVGAGVNIITPATMIAESNNIIVLRPPDLTAEQGQLIAAFARQQQGKKYNYKGIVMFAPFMVTRRLCELPVLTRGLRDNCLTALATVQLGGETTADARFFCSQFVVEAYRQAGYPLISGQSSWVSPADLLHMRTGDVASFKQLHSMDYVGHLKRWNLNSIVGLR